MAHQHPTTGGPKQRGFASMDPEKQREIASKGGQAAHKQGTAHEFTSEEARAAGRKGGEVVSQNRAHMSEIGRKGGEASGGGRGRRAATSHQHEETPRRAEEHHPPHHPSHQPPQQHGG